jgi:hypothetical protein
MPWKSRLTDVSSTTTRVCRRSFIDWRTSAAATPQVPFSVAIPATVVRLGRWNPAFPSARGLPMNIRPSAAP